MSVHRVLLVVCSALLIATTGWAGSRPVAVSPGSPEGVSLIESRCPTFSWTAVPGAESYELVVYQVGDEGEEAQPVLGETFAGSASSWTPSLDRCVERGGQYAWSVRAVAEKGALEWSSPSLFQVASGPSEAEFEEALLVVRGYLGVRAERASESGASVETEGAAPESKSEASAASPERGNEATS